MRLMLERNRFELHLGIMITEQNITSVLKMARITAPYTL